MVYVSHGSHVQEASRSDFQAGEINWLAGRAPTADELAGWNKLGATDWSGAGAMDDAGATSGDRGEADGALPLPSDNAVRLGRTDPAGLCLKLRHGPQLIPCRLEWAKQGSAADGNMSVQGSAAPTDNGCPTSTLRVSMARSDRGLAAGHFAVF